MLSGFCPLPRASPRQYLFHSALFFRPSRRTNARAFLNGLNCRSDGATVPVPNQSPQLTHPLFLYAPCGLAGMSSGLGA